MKNKERFYGKVIYTHLVNKNSYKYPDGITKVVISRFNIDYLYDLLVSKEIAPNNKKRVLYINARYNIFMLLGKESEDVLLQEHPNIYLKLLLTYIAKELNKNCNSLLEEVGGKVWAISSIKNEISSYYINSLEVKTGFIGFRTDHVAA